MDFDFSIGNNNHKSTADLLNEVIVLQMVHMNGKELTKENISAAMRMRGFLPAVNILKCCGANVDFTRDGSICASYGMQKKLYPMVTVFGASFISATDCSDFAGIVEAEKKRKPVRGATVKASASQTTNIKKHAVK